MNRKLGFRTSGLRHLPLEEALLGIAEAGYEAVEFCLEHSEASSESLKLAVEIGLEVSSVSYHGKKDDPSNRRAMGERAVRMACECGVKTVVLGSPLQGEAVFKDEALFLYSLCRNCGVRPAWETEPGTVLDSLEDYFRIIEPLGPDAGLNLDTGHLHLQGNCTADSIALLGDRIHHVHIEGMKGKEHRHLIPGTGDVNWYEIIAGLDRAQYRGPLIIDLFDLPGDWFRYISQAIVAASRIIGYS